MAKLLSLDPFTGLYYCPIVDSRPHQDPKQALDAARPLLLAKGTCPGILPPKPPHRSFRVHRRNRYVPYPTFEAALDVRLRDALTAAAEPPEVPTHPRVYLTSAGTYRVHRPDGSYLKTFTDPKDAERAAALGSKDPIPEELSGQQYPGLTYIPDLNRWLITHDGMIAGTAETFELARRAKQQLEEPK
jgi:hypothetical protein